MCVVAQAKGTTVRDLAAAVHFVTYMCVVTQAKGTTVRDLAAVAGPLGVTHLCLFTRSAIATYMKLAKFPRGPTITFR